MKECVRFRVAGAINLPHIVDEEIEVAGYTIPKDTIIFHNMWGCYHNSKDWDQPEKFM